MYIPPIAYALAFLFLLLGAFYLGVHSVIREQKRRRENPFTMRRGMRGVAGTALTTSSVFLMVVAVMLNSPPLFYMSTAVIATMLASRFQAWLSVRGLTFVRISPEKASVGELLTVEMLVMSERRIRRPLVTVVDMLPGRMSAVDRTPSLPIAPAFDVPIRTQYRFRPMRRGRFAWNKVQVNGTDALGLVTMVRTYHVPGGEILVVPTPLPIDLDLPAAAGWGISETEAGQGRGTGIEPRGVREYTSGDSMRYIHWKSSARSGRLMVKEFETGAYSLVALFIQRSIGSDVGEGRDSTLERICGNVAYLSDKMLRQGAQVILPQMESNHRTSSSPHERLQELLISLAEFEATQANPLSFEIRELASTLPQGSVAYIFAAVQDAALGEAIRALTGRGIKVNVIVYDPMPFLPKRTRHLPLSASDPVYVGELQGSGAYVVQALEGSGK